MLRSVDTAFFKLAEDFVDNFNHVLENGFFTSLLVDFNGYEDVGITRVAITAQACLPDKKRYKEPGVAVFCDPAATDPAKIFEIIKGQLRAGKYVLQSRICEVKKEEWRIYKQVRGEDKLVGTRGLRVSFNCHVYLLPKAWAENK